MQGEPVGRLTNCLPSEIYSQYSPLSLRTMPLHRVFTIPAGYLQFEAALTSHLAFRKQAVVYFRYIYYEICYISSFRFFFFFQIS